MNWLLVGLVVFLVAIGVVTVFAIRGQRSRGGLAVAILNLLVVGLQVVAPGVRR